MSGKQTRNQILSAANNSSLSCSPGINSKVSVLGEKDGAPPHLPSSKQPLEGLKPVCISEQFCPNILLPTASLESISSRVPLTLLSPFCAQHTQ